MLGNLPSTTRRAIGLQESLAVLTTVAKRFPACATILYNLACYVAQLGHLDSARARLAEAIKLDSGYRELAPVDADLATLHGEMRGPIRDHESWFRAKPSQSDSNRIVRFCGIVRANLIRKRDLAITWP